MSLSEKDRQVALEAHAKEFAECYAKNLPLPDQATWLRAYELGMQAAYERAAQRCESIGYVTNLAPVCKVFADVVRDIAKGEAP